MHHWRKDLFTESVHACKRLYFSPWSRPVLILCLWLLSSAAIGTAECRAEVQVIQLQFRQAEEVLPLVKNLLSPDGKAAADKQSNALVINDKAEHVRDIRTLIEKVDRPVKQARVRLRFNRDESAHTRSFALEGQISGKGWEVRRGAGGRDGLQLGVQDRAKQKEGQFEFFIQVASGHWAYILVGKEIPYGGRWISICRRYGNCPAAGPLIQRIETGLEVRPVIFDDRADIEILPRIAHGGRGEGEEIVRFTQAATRISAPLGRWVTIGGVEKQGQEVIDAVLESTGSRSASTLSISVIVEPE